MTKNFRKLNHTKASTFNTKNWKQCAYCRRKYPLPMFQTTRRVFRRVPMQMSSYRYRLITTHHNYCPTCRNSRLSEYTLQRFPGLKTPIRYAMQGLPWPPPR